jgi:hypothetical protein
LGFHCAYLDGIYRSRPALIDARSLGLCDPLKLALAAQVVSVEEAIAGGGAARRACSA